MGAASRGLTLRALEGIGEIQPGQQLDSVIVQAIERNGIVLNDHDVVAVSQKVVSKSENRYVDLAHISPGAQAQTLAARSDKDPRYVEVALRQSTAVIRCVKGVLIVRHKLGFVVANAGIDQSNIEDGEHRVLLLPEDPDASASRLRESISRRTGKHVGVLITDSFGRAWRMGVCGVAIGCAGFTPLLDQRGTADRFGRTLRVTEVAVADQLASAATLVMGEAGEGLPVVIVSGLAPQYFERAGVAREMIRPAAMDLFL